MFRLRLAAIIAITLLFVLFQAGLQYWSEKKVAVYSQSSHSAYDRFDAYERLSQSAYRYFKQRMDNLLLNNLSSEEDIKQAKHNLNLAMQTLRELVVIVSNNQQTNKLTQLQRVAQITAFLESCEYRFDEIEQLKSHDQQVIAIQALARFSKLEIDQTFQPLIDAAIAADRQQAEDARLLLAQLMKDSHAIMIGVSISALCWGFFAGLFLWRSLKKPIEALMAGTREIANGNLDYRIEISSRDEFAYLAEQFNQMTRDLKSQQNKLTEGRLFLERRVNERTLELNHLNSELKRMDMERRAFLADISHELRTPITIIRGEAEVTLRAGDHDTSVYKESLGRVVELSTQLGKYVNDLLFLARTDTANLQFEWSTLDWSELVTTTFEDLRIVAEEHGQDLRLQLPTQSINLRGDKQRLRQVLFILGDNACRYSSSGKQITVHLDCNNNQAILSISDQGIGIPTQDLTRIFDRHFRSQNALNHSQEGSGLGLALAKSIVNAHNGELSVSSLENIGSTFTLTLPILSI